MEQTTHATRRYVAWASLVCGVVGLGLTIGFAIHAQDPCYRVHDPWTLWYVASATPISLLGVACGAMGK